MFLQKCKCLIERSVFNHQNNSVFVGNLVKQGEQTSIDGKRIKTLKKNSDISTHLKNLL